MRLVLLVGEAEGASAVALPRTEAAALGDGEAIRVKEGKEEADGVALGATAVGDDATDGEGEFETDGVRE